MHPAGSEFHGFSWPGSEPGERPGWVQVPLDAAGLPASGTQGEQNGRACRALPGKGGKGPQKRHEGAFAGLLSGRLSRLHKLQQAPEKGGKSLQNMLRCNVQEIFGVQVGYPGFTLFSFGDMEEMKVKEIKNGEIF